MAPLVLAPAIDQHQCSLLQEKLPGQVLAGGASNNAVIESYYSAQAQDMTPGCTVLVSSAADVSTAVKILSDGFSQSLPGCEFAVRSGGHSPNEASNNINGGVTIDLSRLGDVIPSPDRQTVAVGPGNRWQDVYSVLDPQGLTVLGGRSRTVGVGGLLLSGGMSFFSPRFGMACDNVLNYEVVLANGEIVNANQESNADLYKALKGGSNNFGVVTRFDLRAFPQEDFWGGVAFYDSSSLPQLLDSFSAFDQTESYDPFSQLTLLYGRFGNTTIAMTHQHYTKPEAPPESVFGAFAPLQVQKSFRIDSLTNFTIEMESTQDNGTVRKAFSTATYKNNPELLHKLQAISFDVFDQLARVNGLQFIVSLQPFGQFITSKAVETGGNLLGLDADDGDRVLVGLTIDWHDKADDDVVNAGIQQLIQRADAEAENLGASDDYLFLNYASPWQDPYGGVGAEDLEAYREASRKYDPEQLFQRAVPGGFKLF
ncbi:hypothetical protein F5X68DRAFT_186679 [Plectosphaerella plurivora]|uniref:FAD-binding PCMH-type domain-containing protein n=1 Tax=Plectosphaerella plurivora TaxID=936078 RepID=A0A9P9AG36_9PEZI|nr:hypothetical protein F5X68DRAFT_186679 [Plectosphaerella plurivora]